MAIVREKHYLTIVTEHDNGDVFKSTQDVETGELIEHGTQIL